MAERRRTGTKSKGKAGGLASMGAKKVKDALPPKNNREVMDQKLRQLTTPVLDKYGMPAFDELIERLEGTIEDFNVEVKSLFEDMVHQSREHHARMKSMLAPEEGDETSEAHAMGNEESMSEYEKRLENMDQEKATGAKGNGK
ncbi:MAG: hypothetical protein V3U35_04555 [Candidatus Neomarinimicrobiota bacterium]